MPGLCFYASMETSSLLNYPFYLSILIPQIPDFIMGFS